MSSICVCWKNLQNRILTHPPALSIVFLRLSALLLLATLELAWAQPTKLLALTNGRVVEIRGDYVIKGDKVEFTNLDGNLIFVPLAKVDLETTQRYEMIGAQTRARQRAGRTGNSLAEQVEQYKDQMGNQGDGSNQKPLVYTGEKQPDGGDNSEIPIGTGFEESGANNLEQLAPNWLGATKKEQVTRFTEKIEQRFRGGGLILGWLLVGALTGLLSMLTWIYLMFSSYIRAVGWGLSLTLSFASYMGMAFVADPNSLAHGIAQLAMFLLHNFLVVVLVTTHYFGQRAMILALWLSPILWLITTVVGFLLLGMA